MDIDNVYKISPNQLNRVLRKGLLRQSKYFAVALIIAALPTFFKAVYGETSYTNFFKTTLFIIGMVCFGLFLGYLKARKLYRTLTVKLGEIGVEITAENFPKRIVKWNNLAIKIKSNNDILIYNTNYSTFQRRFNGLGTFIIPSEIENYDSLLTELCSHIY